jgi:hypothetical protein
VSEIKLLDQLLAKESDKEDLATKVISNPDLLSSVLEGLNSTKANIKYGSDKILRILSERKPEILYSHLDFFINQLGSDNNFLKWGAIHIIANPVFFTYFRASAHNRLQYY